MGKLTLFGNRRLSSALLLTLTLCAAVFGGSLAAVCNAGDKQALLAFKSQLIDSRNVLAPWTPTSNCCQWPGITCDAGGRVTKVDLLDVFAFPDVSDYKLKVIRGIRGAGASLGALKALTLLELRNVEFGFAHPIPSELGNLKNLASLVLIDTQFIGNIPSTLGSLTKLTILVISGNRINGGIPVITSLLKKLEILHFGTNKLSGYIPKWLGGLTIFGTLDLGDNPYTGPIPGELCNIRGLRRLNIYLTQVTAIPEQIGNCKTLEHLTLFENKLRGPIPAGVGKLKKLESISLGSNTQTNNRMTGTLPRSIGDLPVLTEFSIDNNQFSGHIPDNYGPFVEDEAATRFDGNKLSGPIPQALSVLTVNAFRPGNAGLCGTPLEACK